MGINVLSCFDGISCGQIALNRANIQYDNYFASEIDKYAIKVTQHNYPNTIQLGDITKVKGCDLPKIDLVFGGSPCQGFSRAGKGLNFNDPRSALFFEYVRLLKECSPKYFLLENVRMKQECQDVISEHLGVQPIEINSALVSAQNRKRLYWTNIPNVSQPKDCSTLLKHIIEKGFVEKVDSIRGAAKRNQVTKNGVLLFLNIRKDEKSNCVVGSFSEKLNGVIENTIYRILTPIECERLQTIPENYTSVISNSQRYKTIGNAWTVDVIVHILKNILQPI